jgi:hypothetical protein
MATRTQTTAPIRNQVWSDTLRLPCFMNAGDTVGLLTEIEAYRKPPIPFQSKHLPALKRNQWYTLQRPVDRTRTGFLCVWPQQRCCVYVSGDPPSPKRPTPRVALLRLRIDPQFLAAGVGLTVFAATLSGGARRLWIEDVLMWKGRHVFAEEPFSKRIQMMAQWLEHYCILDPRLLDGLEIEVARWEALSRLRPEGVWEFMEADGVAQRRLYWIANHTPSVVGAEPTAPIATVPKLDGPLVAIATKEGGPDQWSLASADGVKLGRALIRKLEMSSALRSSKGGAQRVEVIWNTAFSKWEVITLSNALAAHSSLFVAPV